MQTEELQPQTDPVQTTAMIESPDNPRWGIPVAIGFWIISVLLIAFFPALGVLPYASAMGIGPEGLGEFVKTDKNAILISLLTIIPAHLLTIFLSWKIVGKRNMSDFLGSFGWDWGGFRVWHGAAIIIGFFVVSATAEYFFPEKANPLIEIIQSSRAAAIVIAFVATFFAPFVEEVVYRGILYSGIRKRAGTAGAVIIVTALFTAVHVPQYLPSYTTIALLALLSLVLTLLRAKTGNLLPCVALHFVFNGIQSLLILLQPSLTGIAPAAEPAILLVR